MKSPFLFFSLSLSMLGLAAACDKSEPGVSSGQSSSGQSSSGQSSGQSSSGQPPVPKVDGGADAQTGDVRYLALGDSVTRGAGGNDPDTIAFPTRLAERWRTAGCKVELDNAAQSGFTAGQVVTVQLPEIAAFKPTLITFQSGANDIANKVPMETYRNDVRTVLTAAKGSGARVVVLLQNEWFRAPEGANFGGTAEKRAAYDTIMIEEVKAKGVELLDLRALYKQQADNNLWVSDGIHPTAAAYDAWAAEIARIIPSPCK